MKVTSSIESEHHVSAIPIIFGPYLSTTALSSGSLFIVICAFVKGHGIPSKLKDSTLGKDPHTVI